MWQKVQKKYVLLTGILLLFIIVKFHNEMFDWFKHDTTDSWSYLTVRANTNQSQYPERDGSLTKTLVSSKLGRV